MKLDVDLRLDAAPTRANEGEEERRLDLHTIAGAARSPGRLWRLLREQRYSEVRVREDDLPPSAVQAACLLCAAAIPTERFFVDGSELGRTAFLGRALGKAAFAVPSELARSLKLARAVSRSAARRVELPRHALAAGRTIYLRVDPSLTWMGLQVGGAATHTRGVVEGLIDNGVEVDVLAADRPTGSDRARFVQVPPKMALQLVPALSFAAYGDELVHAGRGLPADFVYQRYQLGSDAGLRIAERLGVPLVLEFNGSELWVARHWNPGKPRLERTLARLERRNLADASLVVVVSAALRDIALEAGASADSVLVNPNGVDVDELEPFRALTAEAWRARAGLPDAPTVGFIGTFGPWHGATVLPALIEALPDARWVIVGDGDLFPQVRSEIAAAGVGSRVLMPGVLERKQALELLACCDVCVSPHLPNADGTPFFGSPTKLFEYMGLAKPIVASNLGQIGEVLTDGKTALLVPPGDVTAAAEAIGRLLDDPELRDRLGTAAFEIAAADYTWTAHVRRILDALT